MRPRTYEELDDLPGLVNWLHDAANKRKDGVPAFMHAPLMNAATAIRGLVGERDMLLADARRERIARGLVDEALRKSLAECAELKREVARMKTTRAWSDPFKVSK